jgi:phosphoglycerol transferase MdoB-like AlkP superfamily enzyme
MFKALVFQFLKVLLFWILVFSFQRVLFSIHNWDKFASVSTWEWVASFFHAFKLDLATAGGLSIFPMIFLVFFHVFHARAFKIGFFTILVIEAFLVALVHSGEINAYGEWNHKLTSRVFMHLGNPDEVFRTADHSMTFWYFVYVILEMIFAWRVLRYLFRNIVPRAHASWLIRIPLGLVFLGLFVSSSFVMLRGGFQQIPININAAIFSTNPVTNDLSINSLYFFSKSFLLYNRSEIDEFMPEIDGEKAKRITKKLFSYPKEHDQYVLNNTKPNIVLVVLESWSAEAIGCLSSVKGATPTFDALAKEGLLFTNVYATSTTSEIGNSSIFSGFPGVPEVSISMQPEKHRKLKSLNQSLKPSGYSSSYIFSGDLKYGNIGGFFMDHGFDVVKDENAYPSDLPRGKLNFYDKDLYRFFLQEINQAKEPFLQCAFTGSTHAPYDQPKAKGKVFEGIEADFMNSVVYADYALSTFIAEAKKQAWFDNTLFIFVADHGHSTPTTQNPGSHMFYRIPLLFWGKPLKENFMGKRIDKIGSQADLAATLLHQMKLDASDYPYSKDLLNPNSPEFAFHAITRGYGWVSPTGNFTYQMQLKMYLEDNYKKAQSAKERERCHAFLTEVYRYYREL